MKKLLVSAIALNTLLLSGCATILTDEKHNVNVSSNKPVEVHVDGKSFQAPGSVAVRKENKNKTLSVVTEGCEQKISLNKEVEPVFFVNILSGGVFGSSTDYGTDHMWRYQSNVNINCPQS